MKGPGTGRVLYFGDPRGGLALLDRGLDVVGVVHGRRGGPGARQFVPRVRHLPRWYLPDLNDPSVVARLAALEPALIVAGFFPKRIPEPVLALAPGLNVHPSDLPRWRGPDPCAWTIRAKDAETAVCVQWLASGLDEGDVLLRERHPVPARITAGRLADRLEARGAELLAEVAVQVLGGRAPAAIPQVGDVTWAPLLAPDDAEVDWTQDAATVDAFVRAANPHPGAFSGIGGETLLVLEVQPAPADKFGGLPPGTPFVRGGECFIRCGQDGAVRMHRTRLGKHLLDARKLASLLV